jgi:hypothetical protein
MQGLDETRDQREREREKGHGEAAPPATQRASARDLASRTRPARSAPEKLIVRYASLAGRILYVFQFKTFWQ